MQGPFVLALFWIVYGIVGIFGYQCSIPEKYKNQPWTKKYIRFRGLSWLLIGVPLVILCVIKRNTDISLMIVCICCIPSIIYSMMGERKYKAMLKMNQVK